MSIQPNKYDPPDPRRRYNEINKARAQLSEATRGRSGWESWRQTVIVISFVVTVSFTFLWRTHRLQATMDSIVEQRDFMASFIPGKGHIAFAPVVALATKPEEKVAIVAPLVSPVAVASPAPLAMPPLPAVVVAAVLAPTPVPMPVPALPPPPAAREPAAAAVVPKSPAPVSVAAPLTAQSPPSSYRQLKVMPAAYAADKAEFPDVP